jgi:NAD dependent epimerase/dehydratase family enzyme
VKVVIPGGTGQVGGVLRRALSESGHDVVVLSRHPDARLEPGVRHVGWDARTLGDWAAELDGADAVVNLAGRTVSCRYTDTNLRQIGGEESHTPLYWEYSVRIARRWEEAQAEAHLPATRRVALRTAMVMSPDRGGVFDVLLRMARLGLGGPVAGGRQYVSWIHDADFVAAVSFLLEGDLAGPVNLAAPDPVTQTELMAGLRRAWGGWAGRVGLPATTAMASVGAWAMRSDTELLLKSRRVVPGRLLDAGFGFAHPTWTEAAQDLVARARR